MKNKGFTLIELLAVIIVIAIIAVIIIPKVNDAIETSKKGAAQTSALNYINAVDTYSMNKKLNKENMSLEGTYNVNENGELYNVTDTYEIEYTGGKIQNGEITYSNDEFSLGCLTINGYKININERKETTVEKGTCEYAKIANYDLYTNDYAHEYLALALEKYSSLESQTLKNVSEMETDANVQPTDGWVLFDIENDKVIIKDYSLKFGDYVINSNNVITKNGTLGSQPIIRTVVYTDENGVSYFNPEWIKITPLYYNPVEGKSCNKDEYENNEGKLGNTGCLMWYAYSENNDETVNMILDHNTKAITHPLASFDDNYNGPAQFFMEELNNDTKNWTNTPTRTDSYAVNWKVGTEESGYTEYQYTINYAGYKARIISAEEIALITKNYTWSLYTSSYYFDTLTNSKDDNIKSAGDSLYSWLFNNTAYCTGYGCDVQVTNLGHGYWTGTPTTLNDSMWGVNSYGMIILGDANENDARRGIRPVITVAKNVIFK